MREPSDTLNAKQMGAILGVSSVTVAAWYHEGKIPAEIAEGRLYRFDPAKVKEALRERAARLGKSDRPS